MEHSQAEFDVRMIPIRDVFPSLINGKVYRPVSRNDPTIRELADSIRKIGIREPLVKIAHSFARSLRDDFGVRSAKIQPTKVCLTADQVAELNLVPIMSAKESSANYDRFIQEQGSEDVYELEAVEPSELQQMFETAIENVIDRDAFEAEIEAEKADAACLEAKRATIFASLQQTGIAEEECQEPPKVPRLPLTIPHLCKQISRLSKTNMQKTHEPPKQTRRLGNK